MLVKEISYLKDLANIRKIKAFLLIVISTLFSFGCTNQTVNIFISNKSVDLKEIEVEIFIDGEKVMEDMYSWKNISDTYEEPFKVQLTKGEHIFRAKLKGVDVQESKKINLTYDINLYISFHYSVVRDSTLQRQLFYDKNPPDKEFNMDSVVTPKSFMFYQERTQIEDELDKSNNK